MSLTFPPRKVLTDFPGEEITLQSLDNGNYEFCVQYKPETNRDEGQFTFLELTPKQLEEVRVMIDAALLENPSWL